MTQFRIKAKVKPYGGCLFVTFAQSRTQPVTEFLKGKVMIDGQPSKPMVYNRDELVRVHEQPAVKDVNRSHKKKDPNAKKVVIG